jgi:hypothetical protein
MQELPDDEGRGGVADLLTFLLASGRTGCSPPAVSSADNSTGPAYTSQHGRRPCHAVKGVDEHRGVEALVQKRDIFHVADDISVSAAMRVVVVAAEGLVLPLHAPSSLCLE